MVMTIAAMARSPMMPTMIPARASPDPCCRPPERLIWPRATKPKMIANTEPIP